VKVKELIASRDAVRSQQIRYWDAGAPSYRWNEIGYRLSGPELFNKHDGGNFWRAPMAWMTLRIYATTIASTKFKSTHPRKRPYELDASIKPVVVPGAPGSYPCEHAATAAAAATVLGYFFPLLKDSLLQLAHQAAESRLYAGVQYPS